MVNALFVALATILLWTFPALSQELEEAPLEAEMAPQPQAAVEGGPYIVRKGDTLWSIAGRLLNDPRRWPELVKKNPFITNPNRIFPGDALLVPGLEAEPAPPVLVREERPVEAPPLSSQEVLPPEEVEVEPVVPPPPPEPPKAELPPPPPPGTPVISREALFCSPFIVDEEQPARVGSLLKPLVQKEQITLADLVFLSFQGMERPAPGDRYTIVRGDKLIFHPRTKAPLGRRIKVLGIVEVVSVEGASTRGKIILACEPISSGDAIIAYRVPEPLSLQPLPTDLKMDGYIVDSVDDQAILGMRQVVFIDLGATRGIVPGDVFSILQGIDRAVNPATGEVVQLPPALVGELVVLKTSARSATALITQSAREIRVGDRVSLSRKIP